MSMNNPQDILFSFPEEDDYLRFRDLFVSANFTESGIRNVLGVPANSLLDADIALLLHRTRAGTELDTLIRLFVLEYPVDGRAARKAFSPMRLETLLEAGILRSENNSVFGAISMRPYNDLFFAFDPAGRLHSPSGEDYVMGIGLSSIYLANLTVKNHSRLTLDLGTGCGFQALMATAHSDRVIATDRNPRAAGLTGFNARINGLSNVECNVGDLFEPVRERSFDLIVTNPPFVVSPETQYIFRDSGMGGDVVCQKIAREAPRFLSEGGWFQMLCNWVEYPDQDWRERIAGWFEGTGCDVWVLYGNRFDLTEYASWWIKSSEKTNVQQRVDLIDQWIKYYDRLGIEAIGSGIISARRSGSDKTWFQADEFPDTKRVGPVDSVAFGFELFNFLQTVQDNVKLLGLRVQVSPHVSLKSLSVPSESGWSCTGIRLVQSRGLQFEANINSPMATFVAQCNGSRTLGELLVELSTELGAEPAAIESEFCSVVRRLLAMGFILPEHMKG